MSDNESVLVNVLTKRINVLNYTTLDENEYNEAYFKHIGLTNVDIRSYQLHGIRWLIERYEKGHGAILSDEMGLGKTLQVMPDNSKAMMNSSSLFRQLD
ncbi:unnamed protein product, partial [Rotaria socialis]